MTMAYPKLRDDKHIHEVVVQGKEVFLSDGQAFRSKQHFHDNFSVIQSGNEPWIEDTYDLSGRILARGLV
jgi:hypothetical protein